MLNRNNPEPLYAQLERILRQQIADGTWAPGTTIPSENELSRQYGVSRMTYGGTIFTPRRNDIFRMMERFKISTPGTKS